MERREFTAGLELVMDEEEAGRREDVDTTEKEEEEEEVDDGWEAVKGECRLLTGECENVDEVEDFGDNLEAEEEELLLEDIVLLSER